MEAMRGKRLMFVGDSLNRNQWESLVCLVQPILSKGRKKIVKRGSFNTFYAKEYRATLEFYWAPFLVESNSDNPNFHSIKERIISPERIESHAKNWKDVDYLIFNTYIWWMNNADIKVRSASVAIGCSISFCWTGLISGQLHLDWKCVSSPCLSAIKQWDRVLRSLDGFLQETEFEVLV